MPFNGSGTFTILNTFLPGTTILSTPMNSNFTDIAAGLTDCLTRDGQAGMTAQFKALAGTVGAPGISFTNDLTTGLYLSNTGEMSASAAGVRQWLIDATATRFQTGIAEMGVISPSSLSGDQNNYAPTGIGTASTLRLTSSLAVTITGLAGAAGPTAPTSGRKIKIINIGSFSITFAANSSSSTAANRFGIPASFVLYAGQSCEWLYDATSSLWRLIGSYQFVNTSPQGNCQLRLGSSTTVTLFPYQGNFVSFPSGAIATIPSSGITSTYNNASLNGTSGQTLSNTTLYYAYLWDSGSGVYVIDWSTTGHATDTTTGIEIKSGDPTRVLVGMAYLVGANFLDSDSNRLVGSWFNRRHRLLKNSFTTTRSTSSTTPVEINTEIRINILSWGDAVTAASWGDYTQPGSGSDYASNLVVLDANSALFAQADAGRSGGVSQVSLNCSGTLSPTEGFHFITIYGCIGFGDDAVNWNSSVLAGMMVN